MILRLYILVVIAMVVQAEIATVFVSHVLIKNRKNEFWLTFLPIEPVLERQDFARERYPPMTSISSTAG